MRNFNNLQRIKKLLPFRLAGGKKAWLIYLLVVVLIGLMMAGCPQSARKPLPPGPDQALPQGPPPGAQPERNVEEPPIHQRVPDSELALRVAGLAEGVDGVTDVSVLIVGLTAFVGVVVDAPGRVAAVKRQVADRVEQETIIVEALVSNDPDIIGEIDNIRTGAIPPNAMGRLFDRMKAEEAAGN